MNNTPCENETQSMSDESDAKLGDSLSAATSASHSPTSSRLPEAQHIAPEKGSSPSIQEFDEELEEPVEFVFSCPQSMLYAGAIKKIKKVLDGSAIPMAAYSIAPSKLSSSALDSIFASSHVKFGGASFSHKDLPPEQQQEALDRIAADLRIESKDIYLVESKHVSMVTMSSVPHVVIEVHDIVEVLEKIAKKFEGVVASAGYLKITPKAR